MKDIIQGIKAIELIAVFLICISFFSGCLYGRQPENSEANANSDVQVEKTVNAYSFSKDEMGWKKDAGKPITFNYFIYDASFSKKWNSVNAKYITEKTGVSLNFLAPSGNETEKLNTMIASGNLPDFVSIPVSNPGTKRLMDSGLVFALNKLAEQYDPFFEKVADPAVVRWWTQDDGNIYGYPNYATPPEAAKKLPYLISNTAFLVKKDIYEAIGKPDMRTPEGFLSALKTAEEKFPTVNGQHLIPFGCIEFTDKGSLSFDDYYLQNLLAIPWEKGGKYYDRYTDPEYIRWLKTLRKANEMGLISKEIFIDNKSQIARKVVQGRYFSLLYDHSWIIDENRALYEKDRNSVYICIDAMFNSKLSEPTLTGANINLGNLTMIPRTNKDPKRAIEFLNYWLSDEGQHDFFWGKEGVTFDYKNGKEEYKKELVDLRGSNPKMFGEKYGLSQYYNMLVKYPKAVNWGEVFLSPQLECVNWSRMSKRFVFADEYQNLDPLPDSEEGQINSKITDAWGVLLPKLILAGSDSEFDRLWNEFQQLKMKLGYEKLMAYKQKKMEENKRKLGIN